MIHLTNEQLNEYLDNESIEREQIEAHLSSCDECAARLEALQTLFSAIESLPEVTLSRDLREASLRDAAPYTRTSSLPAPQLPRWLTLTAILQAAVALIATSLASPFVMNLMPAIQIPSFMDVIVQVQSQWMAWLDMLSTFQLPAMPEIPVIELSSLVLTLTLAGISLLWLVGNGLLLRNQR